MDVFQLRDDLISSYRDYATSFMRIRDPRVWKRVGEALDDGSLWPHPQIGLNPAFDPGGTIDELVDKEVLHPTAGQIFRIDKSKDDAVGELMTLHRHQVEAIHAAKAGRNYVLTTGTGSGKSLAYIVPIVNHVLEHGSQPGPTAIVVYPMNALANSQQEELKKFLDCGPWGFKRPVRFAKYTGQESDEEREDILNRPPDILLTNYVMLELILTRYRDRRLVEKLGGLRFLVLDELHTYRGRQGADVAFLIRRLREASGSNDLICVGTSATLSSEGGYEERQRRVGAVASRLFGAEVRPDEVIGETLQRVTPQRDESDPDFVAALKSQLEARRTPSSDFNKFVEEPLSSWIESTFGLAAEGGRLVRAVPLALEGKAGGAARLSQLTGVEPTRVKEAIAQQLMAGYDALNPKNSFPAFAFRLHQFLSRGDTVYASLEDPKDRYLTLERQRFVPKDRSRVLLPLAFCRACGQDYYAVSRRTTEHGTELVPRDLGDQSGENDERPGFLYLSADNPWPSDEDEVNDRIPSEWFDGNGRLRANRKDDLPRRVVVDSDGSFDTDEGGSDATVGWWTPTPFRFCLSCGISYAGGRLGRDFGRLTTLGSEGRSTATTIMSLAAIRHLRQTDDLDPKARKLLSFTDNRQDASLQAGHFNDFVQVTLLRAALWRAVHNAGPGGLAHDEVPQQVFDALALPFEQYARDAELKGAARSDTERAFREILEYRIYRDLERGWRVTQPNLEQCGLLKIDYVSLAELASDEDEWSGAHESLASATPEVRERLLRVMLDWVRRELAIRVDVLDRERQEALKRRADQRLAGPWALEDDRLEYATEVLVRSQARNDNREWKYLSARGGFGQYLRRSDVLGADHKLGLNDTTEILEQLGERLRIYGLFEEVGQDNDGNPRYQLPASAIRWVAGDGTDPYRDLDRVPDAPEAGIEANQYFVALYQGVGEQLADLEAREHTAQVPYDERLDHEERFRTADLPILYCSPTMELGVDISQLNVVNMRNVSPTPANYAQRSGRAGRSGQPALVFTYCAAGSSHDQHFFRQPEKMVAGQVEAPRLELANEDLVRAHVHAVWLAQSGLNLGKSMGDVLDLVEDNDDPGVLPSVQGHLDDATIRAKAKIRAGHVLADLEGELSQAPWWNDTWLDDVLRAVPVQFNEALVRWKALYKAALQQAREQQRIKLSPKTKKTGDKRSADRLRREAENQLDLLRAESDNRNQSDFYSYRYFAAEGFLPGYSFPRLPLSAFIPGRRGRKDEPEFLQRPRFLAISEFGPQSLIYHEGARYRINRVILPVGDLETDEGRMVTTQAKRCDECGYLHPIPTPPGPDVCVRCGHELGIPFTTLFRLQNVSTVRRDRITSDEEERQRKGYELLSGVHFAERRGTISSREATVVDASGEPLFDLAYGDTATIWRINLGWRRRKEKARHGFVLDLERGYWDSSDDAEAEDEQDPMSNRTQRVVPFVEDTRNALLIEPRRPLNTEAMASLQSALKAAIQVEFQLEESELAVEPLPSFDVRNLLLAYESAEGGAGVLRRLVDEPDVWARIGREALRRCHMDPETGIDVDPEPGETICEAGCYDCLLTYRNQPDHQRIDRTLLRDTLKLLATSTVTHDEHEVRLIEGSDSGLEERFLEFLKERDLRLPDRQQVMFDQARTRPDFVYDDACAVIYIDGPHHDYPDRAIRDADANEAMRDLGYKVIRFAHYDDWSQLVDTHKSIFGAGAPA